MISCEFETVKAWLAILSLVGVWKPHFMDVDAKGKSVTILLESLVAFGSEFDGRDFVGCVKSTRR